jgi:hypothetical protein
LTSGKLEFATTDGFNNMCLVGILGTYGQ